MFRQTLFCDNIGAFYIDSYFAQLVNFLFFVLVLSYVGQGIIDWGPYYHGNWTHCRRSINWFFLPFKCWIFLQASLAEEFLFGQIHLVFLELFWCMSEHLWILIRIWWKQQVYILWILVDPSYYGPEFNNIWVKTEVMASILKVGLALHLFISFDESENLSDLWLRYCQHRQWRGFKKYLLDPINIKRSCQY